MFFHNTKFWLEHSLLDPLADCPSLGSNVKQVLQLSISTGPLLSPLQGLINVTSCKMAASRHNTKSGNHVLLRQFSFSPKTQCHNSCSGLECQQNWNHRTLPQQQQIKTKKKKFQKTDNVYQGSNAFQRCNMAAMPFDNAWMLQCFYQDNNNYL